jgi:hypothetical protein
MLDKKQFKIFTKLYAHFSKIRELIGSNLAEKIRKKTCHLFDAIPDILCLLDFEGRFEN